MSHSRIQTFKKCPRMYQLRYVYGFTPAQKSQALETGTSYHEAVERLVAGEAAVTDDPKIDAMTSAFIKYVMPEIQNADNFKPEVSFSFETSGGNLVVGRYDGIGERMLLEHKTTSGTIDGGYWATVQDDEQLLTYMLASGKNRALYTVCQKPRLRQSIHETRQDYATRCAKWFDVDTESKIATIEVFHTNKEILAHERELDAMCDTIQSCKNFYRNRSFCRFYGQMCPYAPICNNCNPENDYPGFVKVEGKNEA